MKSNVTIDRALRDPRLLGAALGDASTWGVWLTILSAAFGEPLEDSAHLQTRLRRQYGNRAEPGRAGPRYATGAL